MKLNRASWLSALAVAAFAIGCGILEPVPGQPPTPTPEGPMTLEAAVVQFGVQPEHIVRLDARTAAIVRGSGDGVDLLLFERGVDGTWNQIGGASSDSRTAADGRAGIFASGNSGLTWEEFVFGVGPSGVERVELVGLGGQATLINPDAGTWLIALREEVPIDELRWRIIGADEEVLFDARGLAPAG